MRCRIGIVSTVVGALLSATPAAAQFLSPPLPASGFFGSAPGLPVPGFPVPSSDLGSAFPDFGFPQQSGAAVDEASLPFDPLPGTQTETLWGVTLGAGFRIEVPEAWNGSLVLWAKGFPGFCLEADDPDCALKPIDPPFRRWLVNNGFAWATTTYSTDGYEPQLGAFDLTLLLNTFATSIASPDRVYLVGVSMGGKVVALAVENSPQLFDGAIALCGDLGQNELFDYALDYNLVAETLAGEEQRSNFPADPDHVEAVVPLVEAALGRPFPTALSPAGVRLRAAAARRSGGPRPLFDLSFEWWNTPLPGVPTGSLFLIFAGDFDVSLLLRGDPDLGIDPWPVSGNEDTVYQLDDDPALSPEEADLNARVPRVPRVEAVESPFVPQVQLEGALSTPVIALHAIGDELVPLSLAQLYTERVAAQGASEWLVNRAIRSVVHCGVNDFEVATALLDLEHWVDTGERPGGDDILDPAALAQPDFGCAFSRLAPGVPRAGDEAVCGGHVTPPVAPAP